MSAAPAVPPLLTPDAVAGIARRANTLLARVAEPHTGQAVPDAGDARAADARLAVWRAEAAGDRPDLFLKRLAWDGIDESTASHLLRDEWPAPTSGQCDWFNLLAHLGQPRSNSPWKATVAEAIANTPPPFAPAFRPFLLSSLALLGAGPEVISPQIDRSILPAATRDLLGELSKLAAPALAARLTALLHRRGASADPASTTHYDDFIGGLAEGEAWGDVLAEYPVLARLLATLCVGWARESRTFFQRLDADWEVVHARFIRPAGAGSPVLLRRMQSQLSDRHGGAGTVRVLEFSTGQRLVYKRRPLELEADFHDLLRSLRSAGLDATPPALDVLPRSGYGWVEHAEAAPVADAAALDDWFRKAGALLCLMHLLGGNDGHMENIIATAHGPVLIDLETLLQPRLSDPDRATAGTFGLAARQLNDSVLRTGLLPFWQRGSRGKLHDIGGFTGTGGYQSPALRLAWHDTATDGIRSVWTRVTARPRANLPVLGSVRHQAGDHLPALLAGFEETWTFVAAHRALITSALSRWAAAPLRVLIRPTSHYGALLERSLSLSSLRLGIDRSLIFEALRRPFVRNHAERPPFWPAVDEEIHALEAADIPIFFVRAGGRDLETADGRSLVHNAFAEPAIAATCARLEHLDGSACRRQLGLIAAAFVEPRSVTSPPPAPALKPADLDALLAATPPAEPGEFVEAASVLGREIIDAAISGQDGFVTWLAPSYAQPDEHEQRGVSHYLYDGAAGIALFLAGLARVTGSEEAKATALAALDPVRAILDSANSAAMVRSEGIGGCSGLGSLVYCLTAIARVLDEPALLDRARDVSTLIDDDRIARDDALDILGGSAGAIMALLALHSVTRDPAVLDRAIACGRHLLARAENIGDDALAWPSWPDRLFLAGFSHGSAGHSAALARLAAASGDPRFADTALAARRFERTLFDPAADNWPMNLPGGGSRTVSTWCHGAPGVLLGRLLSLPHAGDDRTVIAGEMEAAARATVAAGVAGVDHLCCGTLGRVELLQCAAPVLGGRIRDLALLGATHVLRQSRARGSFSLHQDPVRNSVFQPGFFRGTSGIGHALLRIAHPDVVPSALAWQV